eukprot:s672_g23.t1
MNLFPEEGEILILQMLVVLAAWLSSLALARLELLSPTHAALEGSAGRFSSSCPNLSLKPDTILKAGRPLQGGWQDVHGSSDSGLAMTTKLQNSLKMKYANRLHSACYGADHEGPDCALFNDTIRFNIRYARPDATDAEVEWAARQAQIHDHIESLPGGYDTAVGERGMKLSGGERQRIGIARCLLADPSVCLLDEATSALDVRTERALAAAMAELMKGRTSLIVAHRLATVERCDVVAFLEDGVVSEEGPHQELLERSERYRRFWQGRHPKLVAYFLRMRPMLLLLTLALLPTHRCEDECPSTRLIVQQARSPHTELHGMDDAKVMLREAVTLPLKMVQSDFHRIFWRSAERTALLLSGPMGSGKRALAEAAAAEADAQVLHLAAQEAVKADFCRKALSTASSSQKPVLILVEGLEMAPEATASIRQCLSEVSRSPQRVVCVATASAEPSSFLHPIELFPFGWVFHIPAPSQAERKQFLLKLLAQVSRVDAPWGSALRESAVDTLANLTENYTFAEMDFVVRRTFLRSSNEEGGRDPVALHHFEKILAETPAQSLRAFEQGFVVRKAAPFGDAASISEDPKKPEKKKKKDGKDPMESIFGWCNFWLPEAFHLPPVIWAMIIFGLLAHLMAKTTYQPYNSRRKRGGERNRSSLFSELNASNPYGLGEGLGDWPLGGPAFGTALAELMVAAKEDEGAVMRIQELERRGAIMESGAMRIYQRGMEIHEEYKDEVNFENSIMEYRKQSDIVLHSHAHSELMHQHDQLANRELVIEKNTLSDALDHSRKQVELYELSMEQITKESRKKVHEANQVKAESDLRLKNTEHDVMKRVEAIKNAETEVIAKLQS